MKTNFRHQQFKSYGDGSDRGDGVRGVYVCVCVCIQEKEERKEFRREGIHQSLKVILKYVKYSRQS